MPAATRSGSAAEIARRIPEEVATKGNIDLIDELCASDIVDRSPLGERRGREELKAQMSMLQDAFEDFSATVEDVVSEDDTVAMRVTLRGKHVGEFMGIPPTNKSFETSNMVFTKVEDGQITERWVEPNMLSMFQQLGIKEIPAART